MIRNSCDKEVEVGRPSKVRTKGEGGRMKGPYGGGADGRGGRSGVREVQGKRVHIYPATQRMKKLWMMASPHAAEHTMNPSG